MTSTAEPYAAHDTQRAGDHLVDRGGVPAVKRTPDAHAAAGDGELLASGQSVTDLQRSGVEHPSSFVPTLPREAYTSPERFAAEQERIFGRNWVCVGRADDIANTGDFFQVEVAGESVIVVRGRSGSLAALVNVCRHRGARICTEPTGTFHKAIRCPYHAWTYGLDGRLISAPNMVNMLDMDRDRFGLHQVSVEQWAGYVWVSFAPQRGSLAEALAPQLRWRLGDETFLEHYGIENLGLGARITYEVESNWKALVENFMECYHCATIHPELTEAVPEFASGYGSVSGGVGHGALLADEAEAFSLTSRATRPTLPGLPPEASRRFFGIVLRPNAFLILVPDHVAFFRMEPLAPGHTRVVVDWLFDKEELAKPGAEVADAVALLDVTNRQDFDACARHHMGTSSRFQSGVLVPEEHIITDFYAWLAEELGEESHPWWPHRSANDTARPLGAVLDQ